MGGLANAPLQVECYAGHTADERPVAFSLGGRRIAVREVLDRWHGPDHAYFKVAAEDGARYILRLDREADRWDLILMEGPAVSAREARE